MGISFAVAVPSKKQDVLLLRIQSENTSSEDEMCLPTEPSPFVGILTDFYLDSSIYHVISCFKCLLVRLSLTEAQFANLFQLRISFATNN